MTVTWALAVALTAGATSFTASAVASGGPDNRSPQGYWTQERRAAAIPRDIVIDGKGQSYLRRPDGSLEPYGERGAGSAPGAQLRGSAAPAPTAQPSPQAAGTSDTTAPTITNLDPNNITIADSYTFSAQVTDDVGVRSVSFVIVYPSGSTQTFAAASSGGSTYSNTLSGFTDGQWSWRVVATDTARRGGNTRTSSTVPFTVVTGSGGGGGGGGGGGDGVVTNSAWTAGGAVEKAAGRIYFEMPSNPKKTRWSGYVCSGTTVTDATSGRSVVLTAAHCVYDDANKAFARNVLFIPDQAATTGAGTDRDCTNDLYGCWAPSFGIVDSDWATRTWPNNMPWDYGFYVVDDAAGHQGNGSVSVLDGLSSLPVSFAKPTTGTPTAALGYSYSEDPNFMYCQEGLGVDGTGWFLPSCGLSGGASGGPWLQPVSGGNGPIVTVNSYGYSTQPGMGGARLDNSSASCLFTVAKGTSSWVNTTPPSC